MSGKDEKTAAWEVVKGEGGGTFVLSDLSAPREKLELVVSHYEERLDWLQDAAKACKRIWVYHKGNTLKTLGFYINIGRDLAWIAKIKWLRLPNVGRESHTILHHCLQMKLGKIPDLKPDDHTLFLQGSIDDHKHLVFPYWKWGNYLKQDYVGGGVQEVDLSEGLPLNEKLLATLQPSDMTFAEYYEHVLGQSFPGKVWVSYCNLFAVKNQRILAHCQQLYERALQTLDKDTNPIAGHYFERLNASLFSAFATPFQPITN